MDITTNYYSMLPGDQMNLTIKIKTIKNNQPAYRYITVFVNDNESKILRDTNTWDK